jgi:hypothetical protein
LKNSFSSENQKVLIMKFCGVWRKRCMQPQIV